MGRKCVVFSYVCLAAGVCLALPPFGMGSHQPWIEQRAQIGLALAEVSGLAALCVLLRAGVILWRKKPSSSIPANELSPEEAIAWARQFGQYENARDDVPEAVKAGIISLSTLGVTILIRLSTTT